jgi:serine/threonine protein phosphatase PrpC
MAAALQEDGTRVTLEAWLVTDVGVVRDHNEDSAFSAPDRGLFIVADGMGGHAAGEVASAMAVETVRNSLEGSKPEIDAFKKHPSDGGRRQLVQLLQSAVLQAHQAVYQRGQAEPDKAGMGTTLDVVVVAGPEAFVAHVGDSRTYLIRDGRSSQITTDHTVAEVLVIEGKLTIEEAQVSPLRTILVNAIGVSADVGVEMAHVTLKRGDRLLLCSDGLHDYFPAEEEIASRLSEDKPGDALKEMVELAKTRGGHDNITGVAIQVVDVVSAVPQALDSESTDPVDTEGNPFARDEPTETAFMPTTIGGKVTEFTESSLRHTQPMRVTTGDEAEIATAVTIPPGTVAAASAPPPAAAAPIAPDAVPTKPETPRHADAAPSPPSADIATADTGRMSAAKVAEEAGEPKPAAAPTEAKGTAVEQTVEMTPLAKPAAVKADEPKPDEPKPAETKPAETKPAEAKPAEAKPEDAKPEDAKKAEKAKPPTDN